MKFKSSKGFSLPELIMAAVVIAIFAALAIGYVANLSSQAKLNTKSANASQMTRLAADIAAAGGTVAAGASNNVDTTSAATVVGALNTGCTVGGMKFKMTPTVTAASYTMAVDATTGLPIVASDGLTTTNP